MRGIKPYAIGELKRRLGARVSIVPTDDEESVAVRYAGDLARMLSLRTVVAVYLVCHFETARPSGLLGHQNLQRLLGQIDLVRSLHPAGAFATFRVSAAGRGSPVFVRLVEEVARETALAHSPGDADLLLRARPTPGESGGWDVLIRLSPRPLSVRPWRVSNMPGALNATVAAAMVEMTPPRPSDRFLNVMCGSGTLLIERLLRAPARVAIGCDVDREALARASANLRAARLEGSARLLEMDATDLTFAPESFDVVCADLPWGQLVGRHGENAELYRQVLAEVHRVAARGARLVLLTHEVSLFESLLGDYGDRWDLKGVVRVYQGGLHPRVYLLRKIG